MSNSNRGRKGPRGNAQRGSGPRLSNAPAAYARSAESETPPPVEAFVSEAPASSASSESLEERLAESTDPAIELGAATLPRDLVPSKADSALPKAVVLESIGPSVIGANDDEPPPSSTRSRQSAPVAQEAVKVEPKPADRLSTPRADKPKRVERRSRDRGKGARNSAAPSAPARASTSRVPARTSPSLAPAQGASEGPVSSDRSPAVSADLAEKFFEEGVTSEHEMFTPDGKPSPMAALGHDDDEPTDLKILHKMQPEVRARRAKYVRYVTIVGAGCLLLGLAGLVKHKIARGDQEVAARDMAAYAAAHAAQNDRVENGGAENGGPAFLPTQAAAPGEPSPSASASGAPVASAAPPEATSAGEVPGAGASAAASDKPEAKSDVPAASAAPADTETPHSKTAAQEKRDCQVLLDRGAFGKAAEAGERSVGLDPTDGEAWLLLGAAYQSLGKGGEARRSFSACLKQGKKGPLGECKAMLQ